MALSGKLDADFASFYDACRKATVELKGFDTETKTVEASLNRMVEEFSGKEIQAEAALMVEAIARVGGVSKLTETELQRVAAVASEAAAKLRATGEAVPAGLGKIAGYATQAKTATESLTASVSQFDNIFSAAGINIGPVTKGISEIAATAGKSASEIGALGTAGLVLGAGYAGWQVGRAVADFFKLDETIGNATAAMLGFGDVAAESAAAKADTLARASKIAGFEVETMSTAMLVLTGETQRAQAALDTSERRLKNWHAELANARGGTDALTKDLKSQVFTVQELAKKYDVSVEAIQNYTREQEAAKDATEKSQAKIAEANARQVRDLQTVIDAQKPFKEAMVELSLTGKGWVGTLDTIDGAVVEAVKYYLQAGVSQKALADAYRLTDAQVKAVASSLKEDAAATAAATDAAKALTAARAAQINALDEETAARKRLGEQRAKDRADAEKEAAAQRALGNSREYDLSTAAGMAEFQSANPGARVSVGPEYFQTHTLQEAILAGLVDLYAAFKGMMSGIPHFATGVDNFGGGLAVVGERGPELVSLPGGASVFPTGSGGGGGRGGGGDVFNFYLVDNTETLARKVSGLIMAGTRRGGKVGL